MRRRNIEVRAERDIWRNRINIIMRENFTDGRCGLLKFEWELLPLNDEGVYVEKKPEWELGIPEDAAQNLMDELWRCGLRPSEGTGSAGSLKATQDHLGDMQKLSWKLLEMVGKKPD